MERLAVLSYAALNYIISRSCLTFLSPQQLNALCSQLSHVGTHSLEHEFYYDEICPSQPLMLRFNQIGNALIYLNCAGNCPLLPRL